MTPCFFGRSESPLFGIYYPPQAGKARAASVLLCYPGPEEYMRVHWAYRQLTQQLTRLGLHVFKFDYYGTGDSSGAMGAGDLDRWRADIKAAAEELRDVSGAETCAFVGARLGAALAATMAAELGQTGLALTDLVLWDPVVDGRAYLDELHALQRLRIANTHFPLERHVNPNCPELLGYPLTAALRAPLLALDLKAAPLTACRQVLIVGSEDRADYRALALRFGASARFAHVDENCYWRVQELLEQALLPGAIVQAIAGYFVEGHA